MAISVKTVPLTFKTAFWKRDYIPKSEQRNQKAQQFLEEHCIFSGDWVVHTLYATCKWSIMPLSIRQQGNRINYLQLILGLPDRHHQTDKKQFKLVGFACSPRTEGTAHQSLPLLVNSSACCNFGVSAVLAATCCVWNHLPWYEPPDGSATSFLGTISLASKDGNIHLFCLRWQLELNWLHFSKTFAW